VGGSFDPLAGLFPVQKSKLLVLGPSDSGSSALMVRFSSLNLEHVSPTLLMGPGISRRPASAAADETSLLALMRRWFFARKPDAGFVLSDFPATLLQARVFDEWIEARNETLTAVFAAGGAPGAVVAHYRSLGLFREEAPQIPP
jgi:adenylate kinase